MKKYAHKKHFIRTISLWFLVLALALPVTGCGSSGSGLGGSSQTLDIDYVGGDGEVTESDASERSEFITMSYDRESEILLCLALYESAGREKNRGKIDMLRFKLARLREMRSIVRNTSGMVNAKS